MALTPGTRLGPYEILSVLGSGGMGEVYKAKDTRLDRTVAIKALPADLPTDPQLRERFEREAKSISALNHPNICTLHDVGRDNHIDFLVMEYLEGETLAARLAKGRLGLPEALRMATEIASALDTAHRHGIVHRDLKAWQCVPCTERRIFSPANGEAARFRAREGRTARRTLGDRRHGAGPRALRRGSGRAAHRPGDDPRDPPIHGARADRG